jgi:aspartate aminotransferase
LEYSPSQIVISNGAKHALANSFCAVLNPGDEVLLPTPYWVSYPEMIKFADGVIIPIETNSDSEFKITAEQFEKAVTPRTKVLVINSPNNPTGMVYSKSELEKIAKIAIERNIYIISDEIYEKLTYDNEKHISIASLNEEIKKLSIVVNGFSKSYSMTGWRVGYTASTNEIAKIISNIQSNVTSNVNSIAQKAAYTALKGEQSSVETMRSKFDKRRKFIIQKVNSIKGLSCLTPKGAFYIWVDISNYIGSEIKNVIVKDSKTFAEVVLENAQVAVVPGDGFGNDNYIRISYATSLENIENGLNRMESLFQ